eukprot:9056648-Pyramimonas_sp.AAC.1
MQESAVPGRVPGEGGGEADGAEMAEVAEAVLALVPEHALPAKEPLQQASTPSLRKSCPLRMCNSPPRMVKLATRCVAL